MTFEDFWQLYPNKTAKAHARIMWDRLTNEEKSLALEALPRHCRNWALLGTQKAFIPHAGTWLNPKIGRRWEDEIELPEENWLSSEEATIKKGQVLGLMPRPGEDLKTYRNRIRERLIA